MSNWTNEVVACGRCRASITARRATTINMQRHPASRDQILDGSFHQVTCGSCGHVAQLDARMLLSDFPRGQFVDVRPVAEVASWADHASATTAVFADGLVQARAVGVVGETRVRLVYGLAGLADKLRAWDHDLDDRVIELAKLALVLEVGGGSTPAAIHLVSASAPLVFEMTNATGAIERHAMPRSRYEELVASATRDPSSLDKLFDGPFVSWLRVYAS
jgi:hypothetical protein